MSKRIFPLALAAVLTSATCEAPYSGPPADLVVMNANVVTIDKDNPRAEAVAVIGAEGRAFAPARPGVGGARHGVEVE